MLIVIIFDGVIGEFIFLLNIFIFIIIKCCVFKVVGRWKLYLGNKVNGYREDKDKYRKGLDECESLDRKVVLE